MTGRRRIVLYYPQGARDTGGPPYSRYTNEMPLALLAIAAGPLADGFEIVLVDGSRFTPQEAHRRATVACEGALLFATTGILGWQLHDGLRCARGIKARHPDLTTIVGGWFASVAPDLVLASGAYDAVALGQGEITFREVAQALAAGEPLEGVAGLALPRDGTVHRTAPRPVVGWDQIPDMPWHLLDPELYRAPQRLERDRVGIRTRPVPTRPRFEISYYGSFGCPVQCTFCCSPQVSGLRWKAVPAARMLDDLQALKERWGFDGVYFCDANFGVSRERVRELAQGLLDRELDLGWFAFLQADSVLRWDEGTRDLAAASGLYTCLIGGETGSESTMAQLKKPTARGVNLEAAQALDRRGVECVVSYMIGLPGEDEASMRATLDEAGQVAVECPGSRPEVWPFRPIPGTVDYRRSIEAGWQPPATVEAWGEAGDYWTDEAWPGRISPEIARARKLFMHYSTLALGRVRRKIGVWERRARRRIVDGSWRDARLEARAFHVYDALTGRRGA